MKIQIADIVIVRDGKVLLVQQRKESAYGLWSYPGGRVETGEGIEDALKREVHEELGVELVWYKSLKQYSTQPHTATLELNTFVGDFQGQIKLNDGELMQFGWFDLESLESMRDELRGSIVIEQAKDGLSKGQNPERR